MISYVLISNRLNINENLQTIWHWHIPLHDVKRWKKTFTILSNWTEFSWINICMSHSYRNQITISLLAIYRIIPFLLYAIHGSFPGWHNPSVQNTLVLVYHLLSWSCNPAWNWKSQCCFYVSLLLIYGMIISRPPSTTRMLWLPLRSSQLYMWWANRLRLHVILQILEFLHRVSQLIAKEIICMYSYIIYSIYTRMYKCTYTCTYAFMHVSIHIRKLVLRFCNMKIPFFIKTKGPVELIYNMINTFIILKKCDE